MTDTTTKTADIVRRACLKHGCSEIAEDLIRLIDEAKRHDAVAQPQAEPVAADGFVLVPVEPTPAMLEAAVQAICYGPEGGFTRINGPTKAWAAMLAARPPVAQQGAAEAVAYYRTFNGVRIGCSFDPVKPDLEGWQEFPLVEPVAAAQPVAQGLTDDVQAFFRQARAALDEAAKNPGKAVKLPEALMAEFHKFMRDEPSMFDKLPFGEVKALGALSTTHPAQADEGDSRG
jgi:hypothetical protein